MTRQSQKLYLANDPLLKNIIREKLFSCKKALRAPSCQSKSTTRVPREGVPDDRARFPMAPEMPNARARARERAHLVRAARLTYTDLGPLPIVSCAVCQKLWAKLVWATNSNMRSKDSGHDFSTVM